MMHKIKAKLRSYIEDNFIMGARSTPLADGDSFLDHHVLDSTGFLELVTFLEETYAIRVEEDEMIPENLDSLNSLMQFLTRKGVA
jgi:acyl carrier protein